MGKKRLFTDNLPGHGTVVLNWDGEPESEFKFFAEAFHQSAKDLVGILRNTKSFGLYGYPLEDFRAYPVVFLYRHALELYMKTIILVGSPMLQVKGKPSINRERLLKEHSLEVLRQDLECVFAAYKWKWDLGSRNFKSVRDFRKLISEFQAVDSGSHSFRYPIDTSGRPSLTCYFRFNLFEFCSVLDELLSAFEGVTIAAHEELQAIYETMAEARQFELENYDV